MTPADRFRALFDGFSRAHGRSKLSGENRAKDGKQEAHSRTVWGPIPRTVWGTHLAGVGDGLGIVPLRDDDTVKFAAIDIDKYDADLADWAKKLAGRPVVLCRSKSGRAHVYIFFKEPLPANYVFDKLRALAERMGVDGSEIFPKQIRRVSEEDAGNWLNLPYYGETRTAIGHDGQDMPLDAFLDHAEQHLVTRDDLDGLKMPENIREFSHSEPGTPFFDGPPCLARILERARKDGCLEQRNEFMFNVAVYAKAKYGDQALAEAERINKMLPDPLPHKELVHALDGVGSKDYKFKCKSALLKPECDRNLCKKREFGIGAVTPASDDAKFSRSNGPEEVRKAIAALGISIQYDVFARQELISGLGNLDGKMSDEALTRVRMMISDKYGFYPAKELTFEVIQDEAQRNQIHPVLAYLDALEWDGEPRLDGWLITYGHAKDTPLNRAFGALPLIAAVRRLRKPGTKFDELLILEGPQGCGKSSALAILAGNPEWFTDAVSFSATDKEIMELTAGKWIVEIFELKGLRDREIEHLKNMLSRCSDRARRAYGRYPEEAFRQFVFFGTTNEDEYQKDSTGARRFWPVKVERFDLEALGQDRDQLWAEAVVREKANESIRLDPSLYAAAASEVEKRAVVSWIELRLQEILLDLSGKIRSHDVWQIIRPKGIGRQSTDNNALGAAMKRLGWKKCKQRFKHIEQGQEKVPEHAYTRGSPPYKEIIINWRENDATGIEFEVNSASYLGEKPDYKPKPEGGWPSGLVVSMNRTQAA